MAAPERHDATLVLLPMWLTEMPPAGLLALASYLRPRGYRVETLDLNIACYRRAADAKRRLWDRENFLIWSDPQRFREIEPILADEIEYCVKTILGTGPAAVTAFSTVHPNRNFTKAVLRRIREREPERVLVVGGRGWEREPHRRIFKDGTPDVFVDGEGEETLAELIDARTAGTPLNGIPGTVAWDGTGYRASGPRPPVRDLDALPSPALDDLLLGPYTSGMLPLWLTRGCVMRCAYCNDSPMSGRFRCRTGARVAQEAAVFVREAGRSSFQFTDSAVNGNVRELMRFADGVSRAGLDISWEGSAMPRKDMSAEQANALARSGCRSLTFGIESGSDRVLKKMRRRWSAEEQARALRLTRDAGIETRINLVVGFPGETEDDFAETLRWLEENRPHIDGISNLNSCQVLYPAALRLDPDAYGVILPRNVHLTEEHWTDSSGLDRAARSDRLTRLYEKVEELGLAFWTSNERRGEMTPDEITALGGKPPSSGTH